MFDLKVGGSDARGMAETGKVVPLPLGQPDPAVSGPFDLSYSYDPTERVIAIKNPLQSDPLKTFKYAGGFLTSATRDNAIPVSGATSKPTTFRVTADYSYDSTTSLR